MTDSEPDAGAQGLDPRELGAYFVLTEAVSLLQHQIEQQLRAEGGLAYVQFDMLARLADTSGPLTMTELADGVVYSRSGLTYQAGLLEKAGLITREPSPDDERATLVTITAAGLALVGKRTRISGRTARKGFGDGVKFLQRANTGSLALQFPRHIPRACADRHTDIA